MKRDKINVRQAGDETVGELGDGEKEMLEDASLSTRSCSSSIYLPISLFTCLSVCLSVYLSVSLCLSVCLSVSLSLSLKGLHAGTGDGTKLSYCP